MHYTPKPAISTSSPCPKCGTIARSGKLSCCGDGGSWFGHCGNVGNANFGHTWMEGIQVCKSQQSQVAVGQQLRAPRPKSDTSSDGCNKSRKCREIAVTTQIFVSVSASTSKATTTNASPTGMPTLPTNLLIIRANFQEMIVSIKTAIIHTIVNLSRLKPSSSMVNWATTSVAYLSLIAPQANRPISNSITNTSAGIFMAVASASITPQNCAELLYVITCFNMIFFIVCWY